MQTLCVMIRVEIADGPLFLVRNTAVSTFIFSFDSTGCAFAAEADTSFLSSRSSGRVLTGAMGLLSFSENVSPEKDGEIRGWQEC